MPVTKHVVNIDSAGRDTTAYPTPSQYQIPLASRYRNIWEARLVNITIPELDPPRRNMFLRIDNLNQVDGTANSGGVNFCFAKLPLVLQISNNFYIDSLSVSVPPSILQNPIASMDKLNISFTDSRGNIISMTAGNDHSMQIELTCGDYINNGGGSTITQHGRILGGTR